MDFVELGRTGAVVSVAGLGCGGHSRLGMAQGRSLDDAADLVRAAIDLGVSFIDTAEVYGTEEAVARGVRGRRDKVFISTKALPQTRAGPISASDLRSKVEASLKRLQTEQIDLFNLHGVASGQYGHCVEVLLPELKRCQEQGKIRFLGVTEVFARDTDHQMLQSAVRDASFDVVMVGFNLLNPSARKTIFPLTQSHGIGTLIMFVVRRALSQSDALREVLLDLEAQGLIPPGAANTGLDFLTQDQHAGSLVEAAYRFCRHEPGAQVILTGTGDVRHLRENIASILAPPLPESDLAHLKELFGDVSSVSGE